MKKFNLTLGISLFVLLGAIFASMLYINQNQAPTGDRAGTQPSFDTRSEAALTDDVAIHVVNQGTTPEIGQPYDLAIYMRPNSVVASEVLFTYDPTQVSIPVSSFVPQNNAPSGSDFGDAALYRVAVSERNVSTTEREIYASISQVPGTGAGDIEGEVMLFEATPLVPGNINLDVISQSEGIQAGTEYTITAVSGQTTNQAVALGDLTLNVPAPTATNTPPPNATNTPIPTNTVAPTPTDLPPTNTPVPSPTQVADGYVMRFDASQPGGPGTNVEVDMYVTGNGTDLESAGWQTSLDINQAILQPTGDITNGNFLPGALTSSNFNGQTWYLAFILSGAQQINSGQEYLLATIELAPPQANVTTGLGLLLSPTESFIQRENLTNDGFVSSNALSLTFQNGALVVGNPTETPVPTGTVVPTNTVTPLPPTATPTQIVYRGGDFDLNCLVDLRDYILLFDNWRDDVSNNSNPDVRRVDTNSDGIVNSLDFIVLFDDWTGGRPGDAYCTLP